MKIIYLLLFVASLFLLKGCAGHIKTPDEFRTYADKSSFMSKKSFIVNKKYKTIAKILQQKSTKCLSVAVTTTSKGHKSYSKYTNKYTPTVKVDKSKVEFYLQQKTTGGGVVKVYEEAKDGNYLIVTDIFNNGKKSKVVMYFVNVGYDHIVRAVEQWIKGQNSKCPDMTKRDL
jgi:hypothetical protein